MQVLCTRTKYRYTVGCSFGVFYVMYHQQEGLIFTLQHVVHGVRGSMRSYVYM